MFEPLSYLYNAHIHNPLFALDGGKVLAPDVMRRKIPGPILVIASCTIFLLLAVCAPWTLELDLSAAFTFVLPITVHWVIFLFSSLPREGSYTYFDAAGQIAISSVALYSSSRAVQRGKLSDRAVLALGLFLFWSIRLGHFLVRLERTIRKSYPSLV